MLVDNRIVTREGVCALVERQPDFFVVGQAATIRGALGLGLKPRVIVTEVDLPDAKHGEVIGRLREYFSETSILVLTLVDRPAKVQSVLAAGADGYLLKTAATTDLFAGIRAVAAGEFYLQPSLGVELARWHRPRDTSGLSPMEQLVLKWIALGHTNPEIARICHVSLRTVEAHRAHLQRKLNRHTRAELVEYVRKWVSSNSTSRETPTRTECAHAVLPLRSGGNGVNRSGDATASVRRHRDVRPGLRRRRRRTKHDAPATADTVRSAERPVGPTRIAASGMTLVLVALAVFATWSNLAASAAARRVATATDLLESYDRARFDLSQEESLDRKYRMQPTSETSAAHTEVSVDLTATLDHLPAGDRTQRLGLARLQALHKTYTQGVPRVFAAVDAGNSTLAARLDSSITEPALVSFEAAIYADANQQALITDATIHDLRGATRGVLLATPVAFAIGVLVLLVFLRISRNHRRTIETRTNRDALTGLPNRESFYNRGAQALLGEERSESMTSVLVIDLDRFKEVNDTLGPPFRRSAPLPDRPAYQPAAATNRHAVATRG